MRIVGLTCVYLCAGLILAGCETSPKSNLARADLDRDIQNAISKARAQDPSVNRFFDQSVGYAVFPTVGKGGVGVGGAYGRGVLFEDGTMTGYCTLTQATIGAQLGGQAYSELIFFENREALNRFKYGNFAFSAQASAVALKSGASANARYADGVAVFTVAEEGLMVEASIGGQKFSYEAK
jgi:lipid-binding SYLF domain-containing protein